MLLIILKIVLYINVFMFEISELGRPLFHALNPSANVGTTFFCLNCLQLIVTSVTIPWQFLWLWSVGELLTLALKCSKQNRIKHFLVCTCRMYCHQQLGLPNFNSSKIQLIFLNPRWKWIFESSWLQIHSLVSAELMPHLYMSSEKPNKLYKLYPQSYASKKSITFHT